MERLGVGEQEQLFYEDIYDATQAAVKRLGGNKVVACMLWPEKAERSPEKAGIDLANCLSRNRAEKLDLEQFLFIIREARKIGCHIIPAFINSDAGYTAPQPIEPEDEQAALFRKVIQAKDEIRGLVERLERSVARGKR